MKQSTLYIFLCIAGFIVPWLFLIRFFGPQASIPLFFFSMFVNPAASAVAADLMVSAIVFLVLIFPEGQRLGLKNVRLVVPATLLVGLSFGFPLFLYLRAKKIEQAV